MTILRQKMIIVIIVDLITAVIPTVCQIDKFRMFQNPREMSRTPFIMSDGESYRDMLTMESSKKVADMARRFQYETDRTSWRNKEKLRLLEWTRRKPKFLTRKSPRRGTLLSDTEIFDFTDSRLVNPPKQNRNNYPLQSLFTYDHTIQVSSSHVPSNSGARNHYQHNYPNNKYTNHNYPAINYGRKFQYQTQNQDKFKRIKVSPVQIPYPQLRFDESGTVSNYE